MKRKLCRNCFKEFDPEAVFCPYCGSSDLREHLVEGTEEKVKAYSIMFGSAIVYGIYYLGLGRLLDICLKGSGTLSKIASGVLTSSIGVIIVYILFMAPVCYLPWMSVRWSDRFLQSKGIRFIVFGGLIAAIAGVYAIITKFSDIPLVYLVYGAIVLAGGINLLKKNKAKQKK